MASITKASIGKLEAPTDVTDAVGQSGFDLLSFEPGNAEELCSLHRDPFDRMIVAQARVEDLMVVTADPRIREYNVVC